MPWEMSGLSAAPAIFGDAGRSADGVEAIFYQGLPWKGIPTRVEELLPGTHDVKSAGNGNDEQ